MNDFIYILAKDVTFIIFRDDRNTSNIRYKITLFIKILEHLSGRRPTFLPKKNQVRRM
jgi:hypothetical protein